MMQQPEYKQEIDTWVDAHVDQMLEDLKNLIRIPSVRGEAKDGMPYGEMPSRAVGEMQRLMEKYGLRTTNYENHCVAGDLDTAKEKALDILAHLDVVPVSDTWTKTAPFEPLIEGDRIYGRGTSDDKGPAIAALYAMRCVKELGLDLKKGVRLICGSDEECGSSDLEYYYEREKEALYTFSPDADFPLINIEKGRLSRSFSAEGSADRNASGENNQIRIRSIHAGDTTNIVPGRGTLVLSGASSQVLFDAAEKTRRKIEAVSKNADQAKITWSGQDDEHVVLFEGISSHAADPAEGINSVTMILEFLKNLDLAGAPGEKLLLEIGKLWPHGEFHGESLGVFYSDEESGVLTMTLDILNYETTNDGRSYRIEGWFDCRAPLCCTNENLTRKMWETLDQAGFEMEEGEMVPAHYVSADSELVQKLLESYELYFGQKGKPIAIGGGTYVHELERGVAFGCAVPEVDNRMHGDDEFMEISMLVKSTKIFADAIMRLCG